MGVTSMIVVSILEGKNFPVRHDKLLVVEANFDGEVMATDPVAHVTFPNFNTELAWEVDKKALQMHRLQRTSIKLLWYAVDLELTRKESIGYIILDLRGAWEKAQNPRWFPLLNCKYQRDKPSVLLLLFLEKETVQPDLIAQKNHMFNGARTYTVNELKPLKKNTSTSSVTKTVGRIIDNGLPPSSSADILKPALLPDSSRYRIGTPDLCNENFIFSVTLAFAANLNKLAPPATLRTTKDYYFYYSLFENDVTTGRFASLSNPDFLAERASVKISSSADLLSSYFEHHPSLELLLCCGDVALASGQIPLGPLASVNTHNIDDEPLCIEGSVQIHPIEKPCKTGTSDDLSPFVGVTVVLQRVKEEVIQEKPKLSSQDSETHSKHVGNSVPMSQRCISNNPLSNGEVNGNGVGHKEFNDIPVQVKHEYRRSHSQEHRAAPSSQAETPLSLQNGIDGYSQNFQKHFTLKSPPVPQRNSKYSTMKRPNYNPGSENSPNDNVPHHFSFSLDLCNFRATHLDRPVNVFIRYSYPFFGSSASILTQPDMEIRPATVINIPNGFCSFNFATTFGLLKTTFCESPLILELVHRKKQGYKEEQLIGTSRLNLFQVLEASASNYYEDKKQGTRRMCTCKAYVVSQEGRELGELNAVITLDDFGQTSALCDRNSSKTKIPQLRNSLSSFDVPSMRPNGYTQDELIQAAFELEVWKERQRELFRSELKEKEMQHLKALVTEWKQRDSDREVLLQRRLQECQKLEDKLQQMMQDAKIKEKQLSAQETELTFRLQNVDKRLEQQEKDSKHQMDKIKMEYEDLLRIDRMNLLELEESNCNLQRKIQDQETEIRDLKSIIESLRAQQNKQPDVELKTEINILKMEKAELQQKFETASASKQRYKLQWTQAVRQVSLLQQKLHVMERIEMSKKDQELAALQQRMLTADEKHPVQDLDGNSTKFKDTVNGLPLIGKQAEGAEQESPSSQSASDSLATPGDTCPQKNISGDSKDLSLRAQQLVAQKEKLLKTGLYKETDQIIQAMNIHIENAKYSSS